VVIENEVHLLNNGIIVENRAMQTWVIVDE